MINERFEGLIKPMNRTKFNPGGTPNEASKPCFTFNASQVTRWIRELEILEKGFKSDDTDDTDLRLESHKEIP